MIFSRPLPVYRARQRVAGLKIRQAVFHSHGVELFFEEPGYDSVMVTFDWARSNQPEPGKYLVVFGTGQFACWRGELFQDEMERLVTPAEIKDAINDLDCYWYRTAADLLLAMVADYAPHVTQVEDALNLPMSCRDAGGNLRQFFGHEFLGLMESSGHWVVYSEKAECVRAWSGQDCPLDDLLFSMAREVSRALGSDLSGMSEALRLDSFGRVAAMSLSLIPREVMFSLEGF